MLPSSTGAPTPGATPAKAKAKTEPGIPKGEPELATLGLKAADTWDASPLLPLLWCSKAQLRAAALAFRASLGAADEADDDLGPAASRLAELDRLIGGSLKFVRNYLVEAHGSKKAAKGFYDAFGLTPDGELPAARPARAEKLGKLVKALKGSEYDQSKYGTRYWAEILKEYAPLATSSSDARSESAKETGTKNTREELLRTMLRALRQHIKTNFPETYKAEWRGFGYLKESY
jgi:hypothetical protein